MPPHLPAAERPNVLWIIGEDLGPELACYGTPEVRTPHLDDLAKRGVRFTRAFTTAPVCSASRSAFITGMYQTTIGAHNHRSHRDDGYRLPEGVRIITDRLRDAGYFTANVTDLAQGVKGTGKTDWNFHVAGRPFDSADWDDLKTHQPFYAQVNFPETHRGGAWDSAHQRIPHTADPAKVVIPPYYPDHPVTRNDWAQYLNTVMALDAKVGLVLKKLREDGLADNTVVIFMGDHGRAMVRGKQWCYDSGLRVPLIIYWPEKLEAPQGYDAGRVSGRLIEAIDLTATTLDIAGIEKPPRMQGRVLFGPRADPPREYAFGARDRCDETVFRIRTVRTPRYRYIRNVLPERPFLQQNRYKERQYPVIHLLRMLDKRGELTPAQAFLTAPRRPAEELYDLEHDPWEIHNLAESPEHRKVLTDLRAAVMDWIERTDDQGRFPEPPEVLRKWQDDRKAEDDAAIARRRREVEWQVENQ
ncbi:MAG: sulfatase [Planctomycetes bacterium]|nr:sulfatase [Planctomycetota bacterium]